MSDLFQVDAFTAEAFRGNPAAVLLLDKAKDEQWYQRFAAEMNLSETAYLLKEDGGYNIRWFTPTSEVNLCGHATLASAHVLFSEGIVPDSDAVKFHSKSGDLICRKDGPYYVLNFPALPVETCVHNPMIEEALRTKIIYTGKADEDYFVEIGSPTKVLELRPRLDIIARLPARGLIVTAEGRNIEEDFVSRFFGPQVGIPEDPVTGSAHCALATYWSKRLEKKEFLASQLSPRKGTLRVVLDENRVELYGEAVTIFSGSIRI